MVVVESIKAAMHAARALSREVFRFRAVEHGWVVMYVCRRWDSHMLWDLVVKDGSITVLFKIFVKKSWVPGPGCGEIKCTETEFNRAPRDENWKKKGGQAEPRGRRSPQFFFLRISHLESYLDTIPYSTTFSPVPKSDSILNRVSSIRIKPSRKKVFISKKPPFGYLSRLLNLYSIYTIGGVPQKLSSCLFICMKADTDTTAPLWWVSGP